MKARKISLGAMMLGVTVLSGLQTAHAEGYTQTQYPIVLAHGLAGFDSIAGAYQYFYDIPRQLERSGAEVFLTQVSSAHSSEYQGEQLLAQVEEIISITGAEKVNLIGHSQGSMTARYVAGVRPDLVASVTSVSGVNWGTPVADALIDSVDDNRSASTVTYAMADAMYGLIDLVSFGGNEIDSREAARSLSTEGALAFNENFPAGLPSAYCAGDGEHEVDGVRYYSWTGKDTLTNALDPSDYFLTTTSFAFSNEENDGLAPACGQQLGKTVGTYKRLNHFDQVNQVAGLTSLFGANPIRIWRDHANRLKQDGL
ncbi:hypothetical protein CAI21_10860 [Alkalilimnicola ehrlichii]|uniref:AB hydrolase-1 domain-containing protein n=1 Tax=Alkalilimnicola ehrlichii TaxID=351052 RepID=A0A3E0WVF4_9GAMM|nr:triacylglycerol lipase [Alkalilimnicola ehrlichii]RFA29252.1 hypothetical protein CAI21_10860 [Alkalilimnicola ehrlichii]RFA36163.1 hypothetical protein CAL65_12005 [Alkalilimnicola ehrlichii]